MLNNDISIRRFGSYAVLVEWKPVVDKLILKKIIAFKKQLSSTVFQSKKVEFILAYHSLTIIFKNEILAFNRLKEELEEIYSSLNTTENVNPKKWKIPVSYDGPDLPFVCDHLNLSKTEIIQKHTAPTYTVFAIGFLPGFLYLGGLDPDLFIPRKSKPRLRVPKGAVGIAGAQTGIYPQVSPGGWQLIGHSKMDFFDVNQTPPCFVEVGDEVRFGEYRISNT